MITTAENMHVSTAFANTTVMGRRSIGVAALDGKIPNLAIMKIVGYHEALGDEVRWYDWADVCRNLR